MTVEEIIHMKNTEHVQICYNASVTKNEIAYIKKDINATSEYIYENQVIDSAKIVNTFITTDIRVQSVIKRTKLGMDGVMIRVLHDFGTHNDISVAIDPENMLIITAMSNKAWEIELKKKIPSCFVDNVFHHGKLGEIGERLSTIKNGLIIIDEIDTGDKQDQLLHNLLKISGLLNIDELIKRNMRFIFVSATMINELKQLEKWGNKHSTYYMTIPDTYIGHKEFLERGIIQEFYDINNGHTAERWIKTDIIDNYGDDYRIHIVRTDNSNTNHIKTACEKLNVHFMNHTSDDRINDIQMKNIINHNNGRHIVIAVKGLYRRANLFPDAFKKRIGAVHERFTQNPDTSVQIQGLTGRMCGYHRNIIIDDNHKTGPYRTSISCIEQYENFMNRPSMEIKYDTNGKTPLFMDPRFIENLDYNKPSTPTKTPPIGFAWIPIIINCDIQNAEELLIFNTDEHKRRRNMIKCKVESMKMTNERFSQLATFISKNDCLRVSKPKYVALSKNVSYTKHITNTVSAYQDNRTFSIGMNDDTKQNNNWQVFIDTINYRLCFVIWELNYL